MKIVYIFALSSIFAGLSCAEGGVTRALDATTGQGANGGNESVNRGVEPIPGADILDIYTLSMRLMEAIVWPEEMDAASRTGWLRYRWELLKEELPILTPENIKAENFDELKRLDAAITKRLQAPVTAENVDQLKQLLKEAKKPLNAIAKLHWDAIVAETERILSISQEIGWKDVVTRMGQMQDPLTEGMLKH